MSKTHSEKRGADSVHCTVKEERRNWEIDGLTLVNYQGIREAAKVFIYAKGTQEFAHESLFNMYIIFIHWKMVWAAAYAGLRAGQCFEPRGVRGDDAVVLAGLWRWPP